MTARAIIIYLLGMLTLLYALTELAFRKPGPTATFNSTGSIQLKRDGKSPERFEVTVYDRNSLSELSQNPPTTDQWQALFAVYVDHDAAERQKGQPPLLGSYGVQDNRIFFEPRFPLKPGLRYRAVFDYDRLPKRNVAVQRFNLPPAPTAATAVVEQVYPTRDRLPENQLKFYLHFSAPMSRGEAYRRVHLFEESGKEVELPFLELHEELWDPDGKRFTLFFDPGRIKRNLKPREEVGPSLVEGKKYTFVIDRDWPDANGNPLKDSFRKAFTVLPPDERQPDPAQWQLDAPAAGGKEPLRVAFPEPLDYGLLQRMLWVVDDKGQRRPGAVSVSDEETRWQFTPEQPWAAGRYRLMIDTALEDLAGNSVAKPFEIDVFKSVQRQVTAETAERPFEVRAK